MNGRHYPSLDLSAYRTNTDNRHEDDVVNETRIVPETASVREAAKRHMEQPGIELDHTPRVFGKRADTQVKLKLFHPKPKGPKIIPQVTERRELTVEEIEGVRFRLERILQNIINITTPLIELSKEEEEILIKEPYTKIAKDLRGEGDFEGCLKKLEEGLKKYPNYPRLLNSVAQVAVDIGELDIAVKFFKETMRLSKNAYTIGSLGVALTRLNRLEEAEEVLEQGLKDYPADEFIPKYLQKVRRLRQG